MTTIKFTPDELTNVFNVIGARMDKLFVIDETFTDEYRILESVKHKLQNIEYEDDNDKTIQKRTFIITMIDTNFSRIQVGVQEEITALEEDGNVIKSIKYLKAFNGNYNIIITYTHNH